ncbi:hypothetical protein CONCODRAFT_166929 [Conidiobolus coronatus NRRL 28638]|uniref:G-protein coupled receptors family 1 profile domain-containing protein n=1 Tax=Conidiobolus coronatus (strain ATCC 28846 / CBS 209.66 / NRRL 28638) TaxID=796925 RepID=A0A137NZE7_CONC2|nr:hypothetical protein CONCODRAFT_166929 [Conidiobolus coronatus NRRL 28638]|eukprot:KXN68004.1 hypothetical protein CONCODRAFT_166929 [Conidiobolus coronatus NRRL 28638]
MAEFTLEQTNTLNRTLDTINSISLVGAFMVVVVVFTTGYFGFTAAKRLSFRLSMWIGLADFVFCCISYIQIDPQDTVTCNMVNAVGYFANLVYIFLTSAMAFNLQMVFVHQQHNPRLNEKFYVTMSFVAAFIIIFPFTMIALAMGKCGLFYLTGPPYNVLLFWVLLCFWETISVIFCFVAIIRVVLKLTKYNQDMMDMMGTRGHQSPHVEQISESIQSRVDQVVRRLIFYPLIPVITQTPYLILGNMKLLGGGRSLVENYFYYVPSYSAGFLNAIVFLFDPALPEIWLNIKDILVKKYSTQPKHMDLPPLQHSTSCNPLSYPARGFSSLMRYIVQRYLVKNAMILPHNMDNGHSQPPIPSNATRFSKITSTFTNNCTVTPQRPEPIDYTDINSPGPNSGRIPSMALSRQSSTSASRLPSRNVSVNRNNGNTPSFIHHQHRLSIQSTASSTKELSDQQVRLLL